MEKEPAICQWCKARCNVLVHIEDQHLHRITLNSTLGERTTGAQRTSCYRRTFAAEWFYHPQRLKFPLKRRGKRGEGKWDLISWDRAFDEIAEHLAKIKRSLGSESIAIKKGDAWTQDEYSTRFMSILGSPNYVGPSPICEGPRANVSRMVLGWYPAFSISPYTRCIVLLGCNTFVGRPQTHKVMLEAIRKGGKLIVIDPRRTESAKMADIWLQLRPGTDTYLLMAMIRIIIEEGIFNKKFVEKWCHGFEKLSKWVKKFTLKKAEEVTWVPTTDIREAAIMYANHRPGAFVEGMGVEQQSNAVSNIHARCILAGITGNLDIQGGDELPGPQEMYITDREIELTDALSQEQKDKQIGTDQYKLHGWPLQTELEKLVSRVWCTRADHAIWYLGQGHAPTLYRAVVTEKPYPIKALISGPSNPMVSQSNTRQVYQAIKKLDLYVAIDLFKTPSTALADYVLPAASWLEKSQVFSFLGYGRNLTASAAALPAAILGEYDRRDEYQIWRSLGIRMGQEQYWPWKSSEELLDERLKQTGYTFKQLAREKTGKVIKPPVYNQYKKTGFATPTGRVELYSTLLEKFNYNPLPVYQEEPETPISQPELAREYPFILLNGARREEYIHSTWRQVSSIRKRYPFPVVEIHHQTGKNLGISDGQWVWIETQKGRIMQKCRFFDGIDPRVVHADFDWWYPEMPEEEPSLYGVWISNINMLTEDSADYCGTEMGSWPLRCNLCRIYAVQSHEIPENLRT